VAVFCGANPGRDPAFARAAERLGRAVAERGLRLVFGGGRVGLMGRIADAALAAGGEVVGVIPRALVDKELAHEGLSELEIVGSMHERKARMALLSDAFVSLPGGWGTLDETCEALTWTQLAIHQKPLGLLDVAGWWAPLLALFDRAREEGFLRLEHREVLFHESDPELLLERLASFRAPEIEGWSDLTRA
jgi:uncharacterized protein (TIGR00730 family)